MGGTGGLRERKRERTRAHIARTAARLFGERGYENTAVAEVARAAEVSEQTVYNYFPVKQELVIDQDAWVRERFVAAVRGREPGTSPAEALRPVVREIIERVRGETAEELRGSLGHLSLTSPVVHRLALEATDRIGADLGTALIETTEPPPPPTLAKVQGVALAWLTQTVIDESGLLIRDGATPDEMADRLHVIADDVVDGLNAWWA